MKCFHTGFYISIIVFVVGCNIIYTKADNTNNIIMKYLNFTNMQPDIFTNASAKLKLVRGNKNLINVWLEFDNEQYIINQIHGHLKLLKRINGHFEPFPIDIVLDYCKLVAAPKDTNLIFSVLRPILKKHLNVNTCPIKSPIILKDAVLLPTVIPSLMPNGVYKVIVDVITDINGTLMMAVKSINRGDDVPSN